MNRTIKDATVKRFHYDDHDQLRTHLSDFMAAYNFARRLKTLGGLTPYEYICKIWTSTTLVPDERKMCNPCARVAMQRNARGMQYTAGQAAEATGKNIATITRAIKSGKISAKKDASGAWRIDASELHRVFPLSVQDLRKPVMQDSASPSQEQSKSQTAYLKQELAAMRERIAAQSALLEERADQISDLKEDRDRWRQQATSLLSDLRPVSTTPSKRQSWWQWRRKAP